MRYCRTCEDYVEEKRVETKASTTVSCPECGNIFYHIEEH